jgi:hypothetical protein
MHVHALSIGMPVYVISISLYKIAHILFLLKYFVIVYFLFLK